MQVQRQIDRLLAQRAAEWVDTLKSGDRADHVAFLEWLRQSKLHVEHYLETEALDRQVAALGLVSPNELDDLVARIKPAAPSLRPESEAPKASVPRRNRVWAVAASLAVVAVGALAIWGVHVLSGRNEVRTSIGEQRSVTLADGSRIVVNAASRLRIEYSSQERAIELASGEAVFQVARDAARPFVVRTRTATIRALGTEFNVYQRPDDTALVSVIEGRVQVKRLSKVPSAAASGSADVAELGAGEEVQVTARRIEKRTHPDVAKTLGWREGRIYFDETSLEDIVSEFNRYGGPLRLEVDGVPRDQFRFGGVFNASEPEVFVEILERQSDLEVVRRGDGVVVIRRRP